MSRRGGKRRTVLQLGNASSKLHQYGYSKEFHSKNKKGASSAPTLVGDYSDSESSENSDGDDQLPMDTAEQDGGDMAAHSSQPTPTSAHYDSGDPGGHSRKMGAYSEDMDDKLKDFLSEIEAIPLPTDIPAQAGGSKQTDANSAEGEESNHAEGGDSTSGMNADLTSRKKSHQYSMFVKGEVEFAHSPGPDDKEDARDGGGRSKKEIKKGENDEDVLDIPEEPTTNWQMVQDETTQYYYYWNMVTNKVTWEIPSEYTQYLLLHREYQEKVAKYTPEQIEAWRERRARKAPQESGADHSTSDALSATAALQDSKHSNHALAIPHTSDRVAREAADPTKYTAMSGLKTEGPAHQISPSPDSNGESKHHRHKKSKKSHHHKKKHRRRESDSDSEDEKRSPQMPDIGPPNLTVSADAPVIVGPKLPSIVPYYSDPEEEEENNDENSNPMPELGPPATESTKMSSSANDIRQDGEQSMPELGPAVMPLPADTQDASDNTADKEADIGLDNLLLVPPPKEDTIGKSTDESKLEKRGKQTDRSGSNKNNALAVSEIKGEKLEVGEKDQMANLSTLETITTSSSGPSDAEQSVKDAHAMKTVTQDVKDASQTAASELTASILGKAPHQKEVIDMFAADFSTQGQLKVAEGSPGEAAASSIDGIQAENANDLPEQSSSATKQQEEPMEEGEITETTEEDVPSIKTVLSSHTSVSHVDDRQKRGKSAENFVSKVDMGDEQKSTHSSSLPRVVGDDKHKVTEAAKVLNLVGYGNDDEEEEEEGEVKDEEKKDKEEKWPAKKKKHERRKDSKKHKRESRSMLPGILDRDFDKEVASRVSETLDQAISEIVNKTVSQALPGKVAAKNDDDIGDIDFEDLDDIDRALEVALEKKLDKKTALSTKKKDADKKIAVIEPSSTKQRAGSTQSNSEGSSVAAVKEEMKGVPSVGDNSQSLQTPKVEKEVAECDSQEDEKLKMEVKEMAELALNKLEFLDISTDNLSRLQILFIELQTRLADWMAGGLDTQYFYQQLEVAQGLMSQYELSAVPEGWTCQWDRANNRYYYRNKATNRIQWEYPEIDGAETGRGAVDAAVEDNASNRGRDGSTDDQHRQRSSGSSSRHRKRDEKDRSKYDKRSSSHRYRRKRRRRRDHSSSSNSSEESQQHRHHHKSKKKKRHRSDKSPSVEVIEDIDGVEIEIEDTPSGTPQASSPSLPTSLSELSSATNTTTVTDTHTALVGASAFPPPPPPPPPEEKPTAEEQATTATTAAEGGGEDSTGTLNGEAANVNEEGVEDAEEEDSTLASSAVISKPPQIIVRPQTAASAPQHYAAPELYSAPQVMSAAPSLVGSSHQDPSSGDHIHSIQSMTSDSAEGISEADKHAKKKKKDKKSLTTGTSLMMKKKQMSSMVQKWQKVKKEVEKEDRDKEIRQAAIRKKIEELK